MDTLSYKTISANAKTVDKKWLVIDLQGKVLGRACSEIAALLRGKHKTNFTPHVDCGDYVIVLNADKIRLTGNKMTDKVYIRHTGYPGGQRFTTPAKQIRKDSTRVVEWAVKRMLPKNKLGAEMFRNLFVYAGNEHPHAGQNPVKYEL